MVGTFSLKQALNYVVENGPVDAAATARAINDEAATGDDLKERCSRVLDRLIGSGWGVGKSVEAKRMQARVIGRIARGAGHKPGKVVQITG